MPLTGPFTLALAIAVAVIFPIMTALLWNRVTPGPSWAARSFRWGARVGLLGLSQLAAVALVGVLVNDSNAFYSSWRQIIGDHHHVVAASATPGASDRSVSGRLAV